MYRHHQHQPPPNLPPTLPVTPTSLLNQAQGRIFTVFACSYVVSGQLLNLALEFPERPLHSEIRARIVNAFRAEEANIIDRSQSIAFDVALLFIFDSSLQRWRPLQHSSVDIVEGCQIYAQPRISNSVVRSICDNADALEMQRIPPPVRGRLQVEKNNNNNNNDNNTKIKISKHDEEVQDGSKRHEQQHQHHHQYSDQNNNNNNQIILSSDDDDDGSPYRINDRSPKSRHNNNNSNNNNYNGTDLALAESWDEACRKLFHFLDDDEDGLVSIGEIPQTLERIATMSSSKNNTNNSMTQTNFTEFMPRPDTFRNENRNNQLSMVDESSFVAFCCRPENAGIVSGLLAFIHQCNYSRQELDHHQKLLDKIHKGVYPNSSYNFMNSSTPPPPQLQQHQHHQSSPSFSAVSSPLTSMRQGGHYQSMMMSNSPGRYNNNLQQYYQQGISHNLPLPQQSLMYSSTPKSGMYTNTSSSSPRPQHVFDPVTLTPNTNNTASWQTQNPHFNPLSVG